jgi:hypothetical protein
VGRRPRHHDPPRCHRQPFLDFRVQYYAAGHCTQWPSCATAAALTREQRAVPGRGASSVQRQEVGTGAPPRLCQTKHDGRNGGRRRGTRRSGHFRRRREPDRRRRHQQEHARRRPAVHG